MGQRLAPLRGGHQLRLLQGSAEFFPALTEAIDAARSEVRLETYIFDFTGSSAEVAYALERAARRGVAVRVLVDGFGTGPLPGPWRQRFESAGVEWRVDSPLGRWGLLHPSSWRRLHRKLCVVDEAVAFCGGINILDDLHDPNHGVLESPRLDFSVRVSGPLVAQVHDAMAQLWQRMKASGPQPGRLRGLLFSRYVGAGAQAAPREAAPMAGGVHAGLVLRDNLRHRARIEQAYRREIGRAREEVLIANAYFVPGRKMRQALIRAAQRGVRVQLLLQGRYEYFLQYYGARPVYGSLLRAGIEIHEYAPSFLHAKVAVIDGRWATVGSSNLDPLSLLLAREANVMVQDTAFAQLLRQALVAAIRDHGVALDPQVYAARSLAQRARERVALVLMRLALALQGRKYL